MSRTRSGFEVGRQHRQRIHWFRSGLISLLWAGLLPAAALAQTGTVTGTVTNASTAAPVTSGSVVLCTTTSCSSFGLNASGAYTATVPAGTYFAYSNTAVGLINEIFDNIQCPASCDGTGAINLGAPIVVTSGGTLSGRNFALSPGGSVSGTVTDATGAPIANVAFQLATRFDNRIVLAGQVVTTNASGVFTKDGLATGTFYGFTSTASATTPHTNEIFGDVLCPGNCSSTTAVNSGAPIAVTAGATTSGINFALDAAARISGTVINSGTSAPMQGVNVAAYGRIGANLTFFASANTNASGVYTINVPAGSYYLVTNTNQAINEVYNNRACFASCSTVEIAGGDLVTTTTGATTSNINFDLNPGGSVSGTLTDAGTATPVTGNVQIYRQSGSTVVFASSASSNASGVYTVVGLSTGTYFALVGATNYVQEVYNGVHCFPCFVSTVLSATPISVTSGANTPNINVALDRAGTISGSVANGATGGPVAASTVVLFTGGASPTQVATVGTSGAGTFSFTGLPAGTYYVGTAAARLANQVHSGVACPNSSCGAAFAAANGTAIPVAAGAAVTSINFTLGASTGTPGAPFGLQANNTPGGVQFTWSAPNTGGPPSSYVFEAGLTAGTTFATLPVGTNSLTVPGVPPGIYYIRVRGVNGSGTGAASGELVLRVGTGGLVLPNVPTAVQAWMSGGRLTITWTAPTTGPAPTGYLLEVGSAAGLSDIASVPMTGTSFQFVPVPSGFYFIRIRSLIGGVAGIATADVMINSGNVAAPPSEPLSFVVSVSSGTVTLTWAAPLFGAPTSYIIEAGTATGLSDITVFNTGSATTTLVVPGVPPGTYFVRLRAMNAQGVSPPSTERTLVVP